jgi:hypothetical protein
VVQAAEVQLLEVPLTMHDLVTVCMYILQVMAEMHVAFSLLREALLSRRDSQQHEPPLTTDALYSNSSNSSNSSSSNDGSSADAVTVVKMDPPQLLHTSDNTVVLTWPPAQLLTQVSFYLSNVKHQYCHMQAAVRQLASAV